LVAKPIFDSAGNRVRFNTGKPAGASKWGKAASTRQTPEDDLQKAVVQYLTWALPPGQYRVRAGKEGAKRTGKERADFKALGGASGWPDLMIFSRRARSCRWIELKAPKTATSREGRTSDTQDDILADLGDHARVCKSVEDVEAALIFWGITPRCSVHEANRYSRGAT